METFIPHDLFINTTALWGWKTGMLLYCLFLILNDVKFKVDLLTRQIWDEIHSRTMYEILGFSTFNTGLSLFMNQHQLRSHWEL